MLQKEYCAEYGEEDPNGDPDYKSFKDVFKMVSFRVKAQCKRCEEEILLLFDTEIPAARGIDLDKVGQHFEHKCPLCDEWSVFTILPEN